MEQNKDQSGAVASCALRPKRFILDTNGLSYEQIAAISAEYRIETHIVSCIIDAAIEAAPLPDKSGAAVRGEAVAEPSEAILGAVARGWCAPGCTDIEMDSVLAIAIAREVQAIWPLSARADDALDSQPTEPWTRTEDRLPPVETPVFIVHSDDVKIGEIRWEHPSHEETFESFMYWDDPNDDGQSWDWLEITHWMPIPPAPASSQPTDGGVRNG